MGACLAYLLPALRRARARRVAARRRADRGGGARLRGVPAGLLRRFAPEHLLPQAHRSAGARARRARPRRSGSSSRARSRCRCSRSRSARCGCGRARPEFLLPLAIAALHSLYSIYIGGDVYDFYAAANRFLAPFVPLLFVLATGLLNEALARAPESWRPVGRARDLPARGRLRGGAAREQRPARGPGAPAAVRLPRHRSAAVRRQAPEARRAHAAPHAAARAGRARRDQLGGDPAVLRRPLPLGRLPRPLRPPHRARPALIAASRSTTRPRSTRAT